MKATVLILLVCFNALGTEPECTNALNACIDLSREQDASIVLLKKEVYDLENDLADKNDAISIPWWMYGLAGLTVGIVGTKALSK